MVNVTLAVFGVQPVERLFLTGCAQGGEGQHLSLAALEKTGAVRPRRKTYLGRQGANFGQSPAIRPDVLRQDALANGGFVNVVENGAYVLRSDLGRSTLWLHKRIHNFVAQCVDDLVAFLFAHVRGFDHGLGQPIADALGRLVAHRLIQDQRWVLGLGFANLGAYSFLELD